MDTARDTSEPDLSGQIFDRYRLIRRLGVGGMGAVYEAEHTTLEKRVAVKVLRYRYSEMEVARKRFLREAKAATKVTHPNIVDISDYGETPDGRVYFVMELLRGQDLGRILEAEQRLAWPRVRGILLQVASALQVVHEHGVVHRDMKPSNCFIVEMPGLVDRDFVKLLDFGIAKVSSNVGEVTEGLTSTDEVFGTVSYMAPEMARGVSNDIRSDVYAIGVMMYRMLVGRLPFHSGNAFEILSKHVNVPPPLPREEEPSISEGVEAIILKALEKSVECRFQTMAQMGEALRRGDLAPGTIRPRSRQSPEELALASTAPLRLGDADTSPGARDANAASLPTRTVADGPMRPDASPREPTPVTERPTERSPSVVSPSAPDEERAKGLLRHAATLPDHFELRFEPPYLVYMSMKGKVDADAIHALFDALDPVVAGKPFWLFECNISELVNTSPAARRAGAERMSQTPPISVAIHGGGRVQRTISTVFLKLVELFKGKDAISSNFAKDESSAHAWILSEQERRAALPNSDADSDSDE